MLRHSMVTPGQHGFGVVFSFVVVVVDRLVVVVIDMVVPFLVVVVCFLVVVVIDMVVFFLVAVVGFLVVLVGDVVVVIRDVVGLVWFVVIIEVLGELIVVVLVIVVFPVTATAIAESCWLFIL